MPEPGPLPLLSPKFNEALLYTSALHAHQRRKGGSIPYLAHLLGVTAIVLEDGGDEEEGIAALLHDAVEDHPREGRTEREIAERFGARVHRIVMGCTDTYPGLPRAAGKATWEARKQKFIDHLRHEASPDVLRVAAADKLYNARSVINDMRMIGDEIWARFSVPRERSLWYYREVTAALREATNDRSRLVRELAGIVAALERGVSPL